ncbi:MAG: thiolase family protein [Phycisphaerales bacterium]|nr:thiolase family protein [Phycisphaerales bacterium]
MASQPVIVAAKRTPVGRFFGGLSKVPSPRLGALAIEAALREVPKARQYADECIMGCVLQAGLGQNPARQAGLGAGLPATISAKTINKVCGSGLEAVVLAAQSIRAGDNRCVIAGGMENMTAAPHLLQLREGVKYGEGKLIDHMQYDGLTCSFECWGMTNAADYIARMYDITRAQQDEFSARSHRLAYEATQKGSFRDEIVPLTGEQIGNKKKPGLDGGIAADEGIRAETTPEVLASLRTIPGLETITAGNASQISDGAAAVVVTDARLAEELGIKPIARILSYHTHGVDPKEIFTAPIGGIRGALDKAGLTTDDIDLFEINEAFAAQVLCNVKELKLDIGKVNVCGGGIALGHPIGASGARVLVTLLHQLRRLGARRGVAALCLGGGNAVSMVVEAC